MVRRKVKIAFLGRVPHEKTKSDQFFLELLRSFGDVTVFRREAMPTKQLVKEVNELCPDIVIFYQLPPSPSRHLWPLKCKEFVWVPMWDGFQRLNWRKKIGYRLFHLRVISFCKQIHDYLNTQGIPSLSVQYFPKPKWGLERINEKRSYTIFLWQRDERINIESIMKMIGVEYIDKIIYKGDVPPSDSSSYPFEIEHLSDWLDRETYLDKVKEADFYIAPRFQEGIGFSFLEAMGLGKVVIGYDDATMNEYIQDGKTGLLFDAQFSLRSYLHKPQDMKESILNYCQDGYEQWLKSKQDIQEFILGNTSD